MIHRPKNSRRYHQLVPQADRQAGMTLLELILACSILIVLASLALPVARYSILAGKERELHRDLLDLRDAIDRYKDLADQNKIKVEASTDGYPTDLETLAKEIPLGTGDKKIRFLRKIPADPMTGQTDWGLRCDTDEPDASAWCGKNVFDVYSKSQSVGLGGTKYSDW